MRRKCDKGSVQWPRPARWQLDIRKVIVSYSLKKPLKGMNLKFIVIDEVDTDMDKSIIPGGVRFPIYGNGGR